MNNSKHAMRGLAWACGIAAAMAVAGCGGGSSSDDDNGGNPTTPTSPTVFVLDSIVLPGSKAKAEVQVQPLGVTLRSTRIALPQLDTTKAEQAGLGQPAMQIGVPRAVAQTTTVAKTQAALQWQPLPDGRAAAAIHIASDGAYGLRMGVLVDSLPDAAQLRLYSDEHPDAVVQVSGAAVNALLAQNHKAGETGEAASTWWTPDVGAGNATLEVVLPAGTGAETVRIAIPSVSHIYQNLSLPTEAELADVTKAQQAEACNLDASCTSNYQLERNAVARMVYVAADGISYLCTGTLVNNTKRDFTPYFLTANHCISTQTSASTLQTSWFYRSSSCNSGVPGTYASRSGGATLLYATASTDSSFLKLNDTPPAGVTLAGWDARNTATPGAAIYGLHHPSGDLLKYSVGTINGYTNCVSAGGLSVSCTAGDAQSNFYSVRWSQGVTEGGSSGSSLFSDGRVIGTLYGGASSCKAPNATDSYGRFDKVFNSKIWSWLAG